MTKKSILQKLADDIAIELMHCTDRFGLEDIQHIMYEYRLSYEELRELVIETCKKQEITYDDDDLNHWTKFEQPTDSRWIKVEQTDYTNIGIEGSSCLGYNPDWVHPDWNPNGVRECWPVDDSKSGWNCTTWSGECDEIHVVDEAPTHIRLFPEPPL